MARCEANCGGLRLLSDVVLCVRYGDYVHCYCGSCDRYGQCGIERLRNFQSDGDATVGGFSQNLSHSRTNKNYTSCNH